MLAVRLIALILGVLHVPGGVRSPAGAVISVVAVAGLRVLALTLRPRAWASVERRRSRHPRDSCAALRPFR